MNSLQSQLASVTRRKREAARLAESSTADTRALAETETAGTTDEPADGSNVESASDYEGLCIGPREIEELMEEMILLEYSDDQARDEHGRWTSDGGWKVGPSGKGPPELGSAPAAGKQPAIPAQGQQPPANPGWKGERTKHVAAGKLAWEKMRAIEAKFKAQAEAHGLDWKKVKQIKLQLARADVDKVHGNETRWGHAIEVGRGLRTPPPAVVLKAPAGAVPAAGQSRALPGEEPRAVKVLPMNSPEKSRLRETPLTSVKQMSSEGHVNNVYEMRLADGTKGVFKPNEEARTGRNNQDRTGRIGMNGLEPQREAAASDIADIVGMRHIVPATVVRHDETLGEGSFQKWVDSAKDGAHTTASRRFDGPHDEALAGAYDYLIGNSDRHWGNWMIDKNEHLHLIDNGLAFPKQNDQNMLNAFLLTHLVHQNATVPAEVKEWGKQWPRIESTLQAHGFDNKTIARAKERLNALWKNAGEKFSRLKDFGPVGWHARFHSGDTYRVERIFQSGATERH